MPPRVLAVWAKTLRGQKRIYELKYFKGIPKTTSDARGHDFKQQHFNTSQWRLNHLAPQVATLIKAAQDNQ